MHARHLDTRFEARIGADEGQPTTSVRSLSVPRSAPSPIVLRTAADLESLLARACHFRGLGGPPLVLDLPELTPDEQERHERQLNAAWGDWGRTHCSLGSVAAGLAVALTGAVRVDALTLGGAARTVLSVLAGLVIGAVIGKLVGLTLANLQLRRSLGELLRRTKTSTRSTSTAVRSPAEAVQAPPRPAPRSTAPS